MKNIIATLLVGLMTAATSLLAAPEIVEIKLEANGAGGLAVQRDKAVEFSTSRASKFRLVPGLTDPAFTSLEPVGAKGHFVRHQNSILFLHEQPKRNNPLFNADATFKLIRVEGDKVRFQSFNYPRMFITVREDGVVITAQDPPPDKSTFVLRKE